MSKPIDTTRITTLVALAEAIVALISESGLLRKKRRVMKRRSKKAKAATAAKVASTKAAKKGNRLAKVQAAEAAA